MKRFPAFFFLPLLVLSLVLASAGNGYLRSAHAIAGAGQLTLVICGSSGAETVTLDRHGDPVDPASGTCAHCADCMLVSLAVAAADRAPTAPPMRRVPSMAAHAPLLVFSQVWAQRARGPPSVTGV